jgi:hypothetical protein
VSVAHEGGVVKGHRWLVVLALGVLLAACSEAKSLVGLDEDDEGAQTLVVSAEHTTVPAGGSTTIRFQATDKKGQPVKDGTQVEVTSVKLGRVDSPKLSTQDGGGTTVYRAPSVLGADQLEARSGKAKGALTLTITEVPAPAAPAGGGGESTTSPPGGAAGATPPAPPPGGAGGGSPSSIDLGAVTWLHTNVSSWAETSRITSTSIGNPPICIGHTKAGRWPVKNGVEGNPWIFVNMNGRWYAATYEWLNPGQTCKGIHADNIGPHIGIPPLSSWRPRSGELVGLMVSALARAGGDTVSERSNVVMVRWP